MGVGHELSRDDRVGTWVAQQLRPFTSDTFCPIEGGHAPENTTGRIRKFAPDLVLIVDAAVLNEPPGTIQWIDWEQAGGLSATNAHAAARYDQSLFDGRNGLRSGDDWHSASRHDVWGSDV